MIEILYLILFIGISFSIGRIILRNYEVTFFEEVIFSVALGFIVVALLTLFLGVLGLLYRQLFITIFSILSLFFLLGNLPYIYQNIKGKIRINLKFNLDTFLFILLMGLIIINFIPNLAPPVGVDETAYHLSPSNIYIRNHKIIHIPFMPRTNFPFFSEMVYLFAIIIKNGILARLISYSFLVLLVLSVVSFSIRFFNKRIGIISGIILLTVPIVMESLSKAGTDIPLALFSFLSLYSFIIWYNKYKLKWIVLSGVMIGTVFSIKYIGIIMYMPLFILLLSRITAEKKRMLPLLLFIIIPVVVFSPWLAKNYIYTKNPVYPFFPNIFGTPSFSDFKTLQYVAKGGYGVSFLSFFLLFWNATMRPYPFQSIMGIGPIFLAFIPILIWTYKKDRTLNILLITSFFSIILWFLGGAQIIRYGIFFLVFLSIIVAFVINQLIESKILLKTISIFLLANLIFSLSLWGGMNFKFFPLVFGFESRERFYDKLKDYNLYEASQFINKETPPNSKILLLRDGRGYFLERDYVIADLKYEYINYSSFKNDDDFYSKLKGMGITHISVNNNMYKNNEFLYTPSTETLFLNITSKYAIKIFDKKNIEVFKLL